MARQGLTRVLAALFPPLAVLASAHELYLRNQADLGRTVSVLLPFWGAAAGAVVLALLLQRADRHAPARFALLVYYAAGFGFTAWGFLRALPAAGYLVRWILDTGPGASAFALLWLAAAVAAARRRRPRVLEAMLAVLAALLLGRECVVFAARLDRGPAPSTLDVAARLGPGGDPARPNVYHFVLDAFQDELLEPCLPPGGRRALDGFTRFHAVAPAHSTVQVLPSILTGRSLAGTVEERFREALAGETSLFRRLGSAGYRSVGFVPRFAYARSPTALDLVVLHDDNAREPDLAGLQRATFLRLWAYATLPRSVSEPLAGGRFLGFDTDFFRMASMERLSTYAQPIVSRLSMEGLLQAEPRLPARGRYTFVHLLLPHNPYVLRPDCSHEDAAGRVGLREQTECTLRLLVRFLETLRRLDRLDGSVVVVHGDHGSGEVMRDGRLVPDEAAWLRTMVLVKPAAARGAMRDAGGTARLVDIAPTLLALLGLEPGAAVEGRALEEALGAAPDQPIGRSTRAGTPATSVPGGTSAVTTLPAATNDRDPTRTPGSSVTFAPTNAPASTTTGAAAAGKCGWSGWSAKPTLVWVSTSTRSARVTCRSRRTPSARSSRHSSPRKHSSPISRPASPRR
jgi:hypothetical protein